MIKKIICLFLIVLPMQFAVAAKLTLEAQRSLFLRMEKSIKKTGKTQFYSQLEQLDDYPLVPYVEYQWLKNNLDQAVKIKGFLKDREKTRYARLLKYKWQFYLAEHQQWSEFISHYKYTNNTKLQCYYYRALYKTGAKNEALRGVKKLWVVGQSQPGECNPIFNVLKKSSYFTREMLWQRFDAAVSKGKFRVAEYVKRLMNKKDQSIAALWFKVHSNPLLINNVKVLNKKQAQAGLIFAHGVDRLAKTDLAKAIRIWDARKRDFKINEATVQRIEQRLAMSLAFRRDKQAYSRLSQLTKPDAAAKEWRVRTALREQNWQHVDQSIAALTKEVKDKDKWRYWQARAFENIEQPKVANFIYTQLSTERSFYGYLSAEKINRSYQLSDSPIQVAPVMLKRLKRKLDFVMVAELIALNKPMEARRQWWYAVNKLDKKRILVAAKYAQELGWKQVAIFTIAKAKYWDDVTLRFPLAYKKQVQENALKQALSPAIIFGLIRRESAFNKNAQSPVGARGLMQIMPKTGQQIARELKEKLGHKNNLFNPATNLKYGSYYYKQLLNQFNGHYALAAAAYNAGPHRVNRWLPKNATMAADIWIETIPFKETRAYVSAVLTYALIYQKQLKQKILTMKDFMLEIVPK